MAIGNKISFHSHQWSRLLFEWFNTNYLPLYICILRVQKLECVLSSCWMNKEVSTQPHLNKQFVVESLMDIRTRKWTKCRNEKKKKIDKTKRLLYPTMSRIFLSLYSLFIFFVPTYYYIIGCIASYLFK